MMAEMVSRTEATNRIPVLALLGANTISLVGSQLTIVAIPWFVLITTGSAARTGLVAFCELVPSILASFFGGALVDRLGHRRASIVADLVSGATVAVIPLLHTTIGLAFWQLLVLVFCGALFNVPGGTARAALLPDLAALAGMPIERATSATQAIQRGSRLLGAPAAGLMIAALGPTTPLWIDAATFFVSAALVGLLVPVLRQAVAGPVGQEASKSRYLDDLRDGLRFIRRDRLIISVVLTVMATNLIEAIASVGAPVYANRLYGSAIALGLMSAAAGGGAMVSAIVYGMVGHRLPRRRTFQVAFILLALGYAPLALLPPLPFTLIALVLLGLAAGPINPLLSAVAYERVPAELRGRVLGAVGAGASLAMPLGVLLGGVLLDRQGLRPVYTLVAGTLLACTLSTLANPALRLMDAPATRALAPVREEVRAA
jgi:MFS family permease